MNLFLIMTLGKIFSYFFFFFIIFFLKYKKKITISFFYLRGVETTKEVVSTNGNENPTNVFLKKKEI